MSEKHYQTEFKQKQDVYIYIFTFLTNMTKNSEYPLATSKQINPS